MQLDSRKTPKIPLKTFLDRHITKNIIKWVTQRCQKEMKIGFHNLLRKKYSLLLFLIQLLNLLHVLPTTSTFSRLGKLPFLFNWTGRKKQLSTQSIKSICQNELFKKKERDLQTQLLTFPACIFCQEPYAESVQTKALLYHEIHFI